MVKTSFKIDNDEHREGVNAKAVTLEGEYISSNIDTEDAINYYFLSFISGTTKWRINRLNKTTYVSDYAIGDSDITTAWTNRTMQTYITIY